MLGFLLVPGATFACGELQYTVVFIKTFSKVGWEKRKVFSTVFCSFAECMCAVLVKVSAELPLFNPNPNPYLRYLPD